MSIESIFLARVPQATDMHIAPLGTGNINDTYLVSFMIEKEPFKVVFQRLNTAIFPYPAHIYHNIETVAAHLLHNNYRYKIHRFANFYNANPDDEWRIFPFFDNTYSPLACKDSHQATLAAQIFGHHFALLSTLSPEKIHTIIPRFHDAQWRWEQFETARSNALVDRLAYAKKSIEFALQSKEIIEEYNNLVHQLPVRIAHNDTKISNLLFDNSTFSPIAIVDLDTLQPSTILAEFGDMVRSYCPSHDESEIDLDKLTFRLEIYNALKTAFLAETNAILSKTEIENIDFAGKVTIFVQGLRFLTDYLNGDTYYKIKYPLHNYDRALNQFALLQKMKAVL